MIVLLTPEYQLENEAAIINKMLLTCPIVLHLRKPGISLASYTSLIQEIDHRFYSRIVLHQHHQLANQFDIKGIHLSEAQRKELKQSQVKCISSSFHTVFDFSQEMAFFDYGFCSPVFASISKNAYFSEENWTLKKISPLLRKKAVALGGVEANKFDALKQFGFEHIALLGAVWESDSPLNTLIYSCNLWEKNV
jgi:thiamine-phosphate pyrophosphorylase